MKTQSFSTFLALASGLQQVSATWGNAPSFPCPGKSGEHCIPDQEGGYNWGSLNPGSFGSFGGLDFFGFECSNKFDKRDDLTKRTFQDKCIKGVASPDVQKCPQISCGGSQIDKFSVDHFDVSVEYDCELEFHYGMEDGSTCKHKSSCQKSGTTVKNTQCGGAKNVTVVLPSPPKGKPTCTVGIHSIGFNCPTPSKSTTVKPTPTPTKPVTTTSPPVVTTPPTSSKSLTSSRPTTSSTSLDCQHDNCLRQFLQSTSVTQFCATYTTAVNTASTGLPSYVSQCGGSPSRISSACSCVATSPVSSTSSSPVSSPTTSPTTSQSSSSTPSTSAPTTSPPVESTSSSSPTTTSVPEKSTTIVIETTVTTCPVTNTYTTGGTTSTEVTQTVSTIVVTKTSTVCHQCEQPTSGPVGVPTSSPTASAPVTQPTSPCPDVLPSCMNTWLTIPGCSSNTDSGCLCPHAEFTVYVYECLYAHVTSQEELAAAIIYYQGICAPYVSQNPGLISAAPTVTVTAGGISGPVTTVQVMTTVVVSGTEGNGAASTTVYSSAVTVPQVVFTSVSGTAAGLIPGTPSPTPAQSSFAVIASTTKASNATQPTNTSSPKFTGAAARSSIGFGGVAAAVVLAVFAL